MTDTASAQGSRPVRGSPDLRSRPGGWVVFAGIMVYVLGHFRVVERLVALFDKGYYVVAASGRWSRSTTPRGAGVQMVLWCHRVRARRRGRPSR
jgi:hypothetical protein